jgi:hypothetical protein
MTHGSDGGMLFAKDTDYLTSDVWSPFLRDDLEDKLKLFIFQVMELIMC